MFENRKRHFYQNHKLISTTPSNKPVFEVTPNMIKFILFIVFIGAIVWFVLLSDYFKIKNIEINGSLNPEVKAEIDKFIGKNIFIFQPGKIKDDLSKKQSSIESMEIFRGIPDTIKVQVNVREPAIGWKSHDDIYFVDLGGIIFELKDNEKYVSGDKKIPFIEDTKNIEVVEGAPIVTGEFVQFVLKLTNSLKKDFNIEVKSLKVAETTFQIEIETDQNFKIIIGSSINLDNQMKALKRVLEEKREEIKEYVDLRIEGRVYYK